MKLLFLICAFVLCADTFLEVHYLCSSRAETANVIADEQEEQQENTELPSLSFIDKTTSHPQYQFSFYPVFTEIKFQSPGNLHPADYVQALYQPPEA